MKSVKNTLLISLIGVAYC